MMLYNAITHIHVKIISLKEEINLDSVPWLCKSWESEIGSGIDLDLCKLVERLLL